MTKKYDAVVFIGRFQPVHNAHVQILKKAAELSDRVIVIVGSADQPRTYKNPFSFTERQQLIQQLESEIDAELVIVPTKDTIYNDNAWAARVQDIVASNVTDAAAKVAIIGHKKDETSFYLDMFPQWSLEEVALVEELSATKIRDLYFRNDFNPNFLKSVVPAPTLDWLIGFSLTEEFQQVIRERVFVETYKRQFEHLAYPPVFVTVDAVVVQSGHVLMVKRRAEPGRGLWAIPGGFLDAGSDPSVESAMLRELREETGLKVPTPVLKGNIKANKVYDAINRSSRGRTITHAFYIHLPDGELPKVKGGSDAEKAQWVPLCKIKSEECFEDHWEIIGNLTGTTL